MLQERTENPGRATACVALAILTVAALWLGWVGSLAPATPDRGAPPHSVASRPAAGVRADTRAPPHAGTLSGDAPRDPSADGSPAAGRYLFPGDGCAEIVARLGPLADEDDVALHLTVEATTMCASPARPGWRTRVTEAKAVDFMGWRDAFCRGVTVEAGERDRLLRKRMARLRSLYAGVDKDGDEAAGYMLDMALEAGSVEAMHMATAELQIGTSWHVGRDLVEGTPYAAKLPRYQEVALEALICEKTGGCGPSGLRTAMLCLTSLAPSCRSGQSAYDNWDDEFSPAERVIVAGLRDRIAEAQQRNAAARGR